VTEAARQLLLQGAAALGVELVPAQLASFALLAAELRNWNRRINLTAIRGEEEVVLKHFVDSLTLLPLVRTARTLLDLGSGAGFPGLPLKIVLPDLAVVSVDAVEKKILFQRHAARTLGLTGFTPLHCRGEELPARYPAGFDVIVARAFADLPSFLRLAQPLLAPGGTIIAMKGEGGCREAEAAAAAVTALGLAIREVRVFRLPVSGESRSLIILAQTASAT
jgi:16S rRNA (guanine527-N7)-methyltransferase